MKDNSEAILSFIEETILKDYEKLIKGSEQYNDDAVLINKLMEEFEVTASQVNTAVSSISTAMNEVSATINESARGVQEIAEKTVEILDQTLIESKSADENSKISKELLELIENFKI